MAMESSNAFGWNVLSLLAKDDGQAKNLFLSPFSISVALAMTRLGANGQTAAGMEKALCWKTDGDIIHKEFKEYVMKLKKPCADYTLRTANRLYIEKGYPIQDDFMKQTKELYLAEPVLSEFSSNPEAETNNINKWVEDQTEKKIKDLIGPGVLTGLTRMVLVNAIYFKGQWEHIFEKNRTEPKPFHVSSSENKSVPMMQMSRKLPYHETENYTVLELPYKGGQLSMAIFLPRDRFGLEALEKKLTMREIKESFSQLNSMGKIEVSLPRFEISSSFMMKNILSQLGMAEAFDENAADFSGMTGTKELYISQVLHKAFLKVNEEGSEAAAATSVVMMSRSMPIPPIKVDVDHPFLVVIRDKTNDMILFIGHVTDPTMSD